jgi:lipoyl(octanoyl) transferase
VNFRLIKDSARDGAFNMAIDDLFYQQREDRQETSAVLRIYRWSPPALSLGFHQRYDIACDEDFLRSRNINIVRRPTGGKAVLHHEELTYSVIASLEEGYFKGDTLDESYAKIALGLKKSLEVLGLKPELEKRDKRLNVLSPSPCFLVPTQKEILIGGKKVVGSAQKRGNSAFLQHGSIPIRLDYELLAKATRNKSEDIESYKAHFTSLGEFLPSLSEAELENALEKGFREAFGGDWTEAQMSDSELIEAEKIKQEKYDTDQWNKKPRKTLNEAMEAQNG